MQCKQASNNILAPIEHVPLPRELYIECTNRCNERCNQCPRTHLTREPDHDMALEDVAMIVDQLPNIDRVVLHGLGEPLLNPWLPIIVAYLRGRGATVLFNTNATALTATVGRSLIAAGLNELRVSLDGATPATYARVRGVNEKTLPRVMRHIAAFTKMRDELGVTTPRVSYWFTAMRKNLSELPNLVDIALATNVTEIYVQRLRYFDMGLAREEQSLYRKAMKEELEIIETTATRCQEHGIMFRATGLTTPQEYLSSREINEEPRPWSACERPRKLAYISANGNVYSCCFAPFHPGQAQERVLGNVFEQSFADIWNGARYQEFRAAFDSNTPWDQCAGCGSKWSL
jgi:radical SAM protein with 4Fe4S-binding SPASM domain